MASKMVMVIAFVIDFVAFLLAVAAEQRRSTATTVDIGASSYCHYNTDIATSLGVGAFILLLASQLLIMLASRCLCCGRGLRPGGARRWAIVFFTSCWILFVIAEVCLLAGSVKNAYHTKYGRLVFTKSPSCSTLRKGVFGAGAAFIVLTGIVSELCYVYYSKASNTINSTYKQDTGVRMGNL